MKFLVIVFACVVAVSAVKPRFNTRFQRQEVPHDVYGPPPEEYGPPPQETTTQAQSNSTTTEGPTTTEPQSELINGTRTKGRLTNGRGPGVYYIYHPSGQLQKVVYSTKKDSRSRAYTTQLKYEDVEPITAPIFTYDPKTLVLTPLQP